MGMAASGIYGGVKLLAYDTAVLKGVHVQQHKEGDEYVLDVESELLVPPTGDSGTIWITFPELGLSEKIRLTMDGSLQQVGGGGYKCATTIVVQQWQRGSNLTRTHFGTAASLWQLSSGVVLCDCRQLAVLCHKDAAGHRVVCPAHCNAVKQQTVPSISVCTQPQCCCIADFAASCYRLPPRSCFPCCVMCADLCPWQHEREGQ